MSQLIIDGVKHTFNGGIVSIRKNIKINNKVVYRNTNRVKNPVKLIVTGDLVKVDTMGDVEVTGDVRGDINTMGDVKCGDVGGSVNTMGDVTANAIKGGKISTMGDVTLH